MVRVNSELEKKIEERVVKWAKNNGWLARKMNGLGYNSWPDRLFLKRENCHAYIEFKRPGKTPTDQQQDLLTELTRRGFNAVWFDNSDRAIEYLQDLDARSLPKARRKVSATK